MLMSCLSFKSSRPSFKNSNELMVLRPEEIESGDKAIYTTRTMLKAEKTLVETAESLINQKAMVLRACTSIRPLQKPMKL